MKFSLEILDLDVLVVDLVHDMVENLLSPVEILIGIYI